MISLLHKRCLKKRPSILISKDVMLGFAKSDVYIIGEKADIFKQCPYHIRNDR